MASIQRQNLVLIEKILLETGKNSMFWISFTMEHMSLLQTQLSQPSTASG